MYYVLGINKGVCNTNCIRLPLKFIYIYIVGIIYGWEIVGSKMATTIDAIEE